MTMYWADFNILISIFAMSHHDRWSRQESMEQEFLGYHLQLNVSSFWLYFFPQEDLENEHGTVTFPAD